MGKIMFLWGSEEDGQSKNGPQWALGGDTFVVGARIPDCIVYPEFNKLNPDMQHPIYSTENGIYKPGCGLANLHFSFGHDEYMYRMLKANDAKIPQIGLEIIRYHSCYPMHSNGAYK